MATQVLDRRFMAPLEFDVHAAKRVAVMYCEYCRMPFVTSKDEALHPGDYINLWRGASHRPPLLCDHCAVHQYDAVESAEENRAIIEALNEEKARFHKPREVFHQPRKKTESAIRARSKWARWRIPLMEAFQQKQELTSAMIATVITGKLDTSSGQRGEAVARARACGIPIVVVRQDKVPSCKGLRTRNWYGLSSKPLEELEPLAPMPLQDPVTHQFMREVQ
jgi:hypothetical protein